MYMWLEQWPLIAYFQRLSSLLHSLDHDNGFLHWHPTCADFDTEMLNLDKLLPCPAWR
jgi:hypothetical protein